MLILKLEYSLTVKFITLYDRFTSRFHKYISEIRIVWSKVGYDVTCSETLYVVDFTDNFFQGPCSNHVKGGVNWGDQGGVRERKGNIKLKPFRILLIMIVRRLQKY